MMPLSGVRISWRRHRQEARLGAVGGIGLVARLGQRALGLGAVGDVAADALQFGGLAGIGAHETFAPGDPARAERASAIFWSWTRVPLGSSALSPCSRISKAKPAADQRLARPSAQAAQ